MPLRRRLGADADSVHGQVDALLDSEDGVIVLVDGSRAISYAQGFGITRPHPELQATSDETVAPDDSPPALVRENVIDVSRPATDGRTFLKGLVSLTGAVGIALLVPFVILLIGAPIALAVRGTVEAISWLLALIF